MKLQRNQQGCHTLRRDPQRIVHLIQFAAGVVFFAFGATVGIILLSIANGNPLFALPTFIVFGAAGAISVVLGCRGISRARQLNKVGVVVHGTVTGVQVQQLSRQLCGHVTLEFAWDGHTRQVTTKVLGNAIEYARYLEDSGSSIPLLIDPMRPHQFRMCEYQELGYPDERCDICNGLTQLQESDGFKVRVKVEKVGAAKLVPFDSELTVTDKEIIVKHPQLPISKRRCHRVANSVGPEGLELCAIDDPSDRYHVTINGIFGSNSKLRDAIIDAIDNEKPLPSLLEHQLPRTHWAAILFPVVLLPSPLHVIFPLVLVAANMAVMSSDRLPRSWRLISVLILDLLPLSFWGYLWFQT